MRRLSKALVSIAAIGLPILAGARKVDAITLEADYWVFDPVNLAEPWYARQSWTKLANDDNYLRIRYWDCSENQNNDIIIRDDGTSQFPDFDFVDDDAAVSTDEAVR